MNYRKSLIDILEPLVASMVFPITIYKQIVTGNDHLLYVNDVYHAQVGFNAIIDGLPYKIISVNAALNQMTVTDEENSGAITATSFHLYEPYFFHGTVRETDAELTQNQNAFTKTPMIWVMDGFEETENEDPDSAIERVSYPRIFFLTQSDFSKVTNELHDNYEEPMKRLKDQFVKLIRDNYDRFEVSDWSTKITRYSKFGVYINSSIDKSLFADNLSGIEIQPSFNILSIDGCCQEEPIFITDEDGVPLIGNDNEMIIL